MPQKEQIEIKMIDWFDSHFYKIKYLNEAKVEVEDYIPSVTTKLGALDKPHLRNWYGQIGNFEANRIMREAGDRGTRIHYAWEVYTTGGTVIYNPIKVFLYTPEEIKELIDSSGGNYCILTDQHEMYDFMKMVQVYEMLNPVEKFSEMIVYDIDLRCAGTMDNFFRINGGEYRFNGKDPVKIPAGWIIHDLKSGKSVSDDARMQVSTYGKCVEYMRSVGAFEFEGKIVGALISHTSASSRSGIEGYKGHFINREEMYGYHQDYLDISKVWDRQFGKKKPTIRTLPGFVKIGG